MKLLFDQNLSRKLVNRLADVFPDASHVQFHGLTEASDSDIWEFAKSQGFCIVTQDVDFVEMSYLYDSPPKVIWLRCGNAPSLQVESILTTAREAIQNLLDNPSVNCIELY